MRGFAFVATALPAVTRSLNTNATRPCERKEKKKEGGKKGQDKRNIPYVRLRDSAREIRIVVASRRGAKTFNRRYFRDLQAKMESRCTANENSRGTNLTRKRVLQFFHRNFIFGRVFCVDAVRTLRTDRMVMVRVITKKSARITNTRKHVVDEELRDEWRDGWRLYARASRPGISYELYAF